MNCSVCGAALVPGVDACVSCGQPTTARSVSLDIRVFGLDVSPEAMAKLEATRAANIKRIDLYTKARVLEISGALEGPTGAIATYEEMIAAGYDYPAGFKRLAIIYRRTKRLADEERVVRLALTQKTILENLSKNWFVIRLATIAARQRKEAGKG